MRISQNNLRFLVLINTLGTIRYAACGQVKLIGPRCKDDTEDEPPTKLMCGVTVMPKSEGKLELGSLCGNGGDLKFQVVREEVDVAGKAACRLNGINEFCCIFTKYCASSSIKLTSIFLFQCLI